MRHKILSVWDLHDIQFQPILQDIADNTVVSLGADNQVSQQNNRVRITNSRKLTEEQKHKIVEIDH